MTLDHSRPWRDAPSPAPEPGWPPASGGGDAAGDDRGGADRRDPDRGEWRDADRQIRGDTGGGDHRDGDEGPVPPQVPAARPAGLRRQTSRDHLRRPPRPPRPRRVVAGAAGAALAGLVTAAAVVARSDAGGGEEAGDRDPATTRVPVEVRDLVRTDDYEGELGFGETDALTAGRAGVVTAVAATGTTLGQGDVVLRLDLEPTVLLQGDVPAFRDLAAGAAPGPDIAQLERALVELGFGDGITVDDELTSATADAIEAWEESLGRADPDGVVSLGDVVFAPADLRVAAVIAERGTQVPSGAEVVEVTATAKVVTLDLTVDQVAEIEAGTPVTVELPDGTEASGTIAEVADEPGTGDGATDGGTGGDGDDADTGEETYAVTVALDDPAAAADFDSGAVTVTVERSRTDDATTVPVTALLALTEGGYAVQVVDGSAPEGYRLVGVEVGTIADEWAEVTGEGIEPGVEVVAPA